MPTLKPSRFLAPSLATVLLSSAPAMLAAPSPRAAAKAPSKAAAPAPSTPSMSGWSLGEPEELESAWAWRARLKPSSAGGSGEVRVAFGDLSSKADAFLRVQIAGKKATFQFWRQRGGKLEAASAPASIALSGGPEGELGLQASSSQVRALWNGRVVVEAWGLASAGSIASSAKGVALSGARLQPTEAIVFSDDFMRASGPDEPELDGSWHRASGVWKTSGLLGPRADAALNPNPFVFRAEAPAKSTGEQQVLATVGSWFWSDYAITASVRPVLRDASAPLVVGLGAYMGDKSGAREGISALVDAREGRAMIVRGAQVLATSAAFDFDPNNWHRLYFEPGPSTVRLFVDGIERVRLDTSTVRVANSPGDAAQGQAALVARLSGKNYADFDDVRAASSPSQSDAFRTASLGRWSDASGEWQTIAGARGGRRILRTSEGLTLTGAPEREEGSVEAAFDVSERAATASNVALSKGSGAASTWAGAAFAAQDSKNYFAARVRGGHLEIVQIADGKARLLGSGSLPPDSRPRGSSERQNISVQWRDGVITARADGTVVNATVASIPAGRVGAVARQGAASHVALVSLQALGAAPVWGEGALPERFEKDSLMQNWASNAAAWKKGADNFFWHTGDFFGDAALTLPLPKMLVGSVVALRLKADPAKPQSGAKLEVERREGSWKLALSQSGKYLGTVTLSDAEWPAVEQSGAEAQSEATRTVRFVRRPLGEGRSSLRAVAGSKTVFALEAPDAADSSNAEAVKCGVALLGTPIDPNRPHGRAMTVRLVASERNKKAAVGITLAELTDSFQRKLAVSEGNGAVIQGLEPNGPAAGAGIEVEDVIQAVDGKKVASVDQVIEAIGRKSVGASVELSIWRHLWDGPVNWEKVAATTTQALDYSFTGAPVDWKASAGKWTVSERWTCSPQWAFFNGSNAAAPTLWSRFGAKGDWTLEAYIANPMDQTRGDRSPTDLNLTVGGDGRDLASGYSWIFGGEKRTVNRVYKGDAIALEKPFEQPELLGNAHQDWFYVRLEKRETAVGVRFKYFVNNKMLMEYTDTAPLKAALDGGRFAFWTYNGALSIARARLWYSNIETASATPSRPKASAPVSLAASTSRPIPNPIGAWAGRREDVLRQTALVSSEKDGARSAVKITNAQSGGDWTAYASRQPFDAAQKPILSFDYRVPQNVRVNLYIKVEDRWREIVFSGNSSSAAAGLSGAANGALGGPSITPGVVFQNGNEVDTSVRIGSFDNVQADGKWHRASIDLGSALLKANLGTTVQEIALAAPDQSYLRVGLGGNHEGAAYWIANLSAGKSAGAPAALAQAPRE